MESDQESLTFLCQTCDGQDRIFGHPENLRGKSFPPGFYPQKENSSSNFPFQIVKTSSQERKPCRKPLNPE